MGLRKALRESLTVTRHTRTLLLITLGTCAAAHADSVNVFSGSLGGTSDFVFRGLSLTRGDPAAQASIDVEFPKEFYVGAFVATCNPNPGTEPGGRNGRLGRPLLEPVAELIGRPAAVAVHAIPMIRAA